MNHIEERRQPVHVVQLTGQRGRQIEPEPVDMHFRHPIPQRIHDQPQHARLLTFNVLPVPVKSM